MPSFTISEALQHGVAAFHEARIHEPRMTAEILLRHVLNCDTAFLYAHHKQVLTSDQWERYSSDLADRSSGKPLQYITGVQEFYGLPFRVTTDALIPRPETEVLVEQTLSRASAHDWILDVGTGTGAIAIAVAKQLHNARVFATDLSAPALVLARENARANSVHVNFIQADLLEAFAREKFDLVVSNPPYVALHDLHALQREVRDYEPHLALFGGEDGLDAYRRLSATAGAVLKRGGWLLMEVGYNTSAAVKPLFSAPVWEAPKIYRDLAGWERVIAIRKGSAA